MFAIPTKLPMIQVKPKDLDSKSLGGYLLNEVEYKEYLFIEKKALKLYFNKKLWKVVIIIYNIDFKKLI